MTQAWLDNYEPRLREAIKGSKFELERRDNVLVITAPVDSSFNPDRPAMLLPVTLGPITQVAKVIESDPKQLFWSWGMVIPAVRQRLTRRLARSGHSRWQRFSVSAACNVTA